MNIKAELQKLEADSRITLFEVDATEIAGDRLMFHSHPFVDSIWWQGEEYKPWPVNITGLARSSEQQARPSASVSNEGGVISAICSLTKDLVGAKFIMRETMRKFLDAQNFEGGNPTADPTQHFPDEIWTIERKAKENRTEVVFELISLIEHANQQFPGRQILADSCGAIRRGGYRGFACGYTGPPVADINDNPTDDPALDRCPGRLGSCKKRLWPDGVLNFNGFPAAGQV